VTPAVAVRSLDARRTAALVSREARGITLGPLTARFEASDTHPRLWPLALAGLGVAGLLATFGLPPVDLHGPLHRLGVMDPLCGGTRGLRAIALGRIGQAWAFNPLSVVLFVGAWVALARAGIGRLTGRWVAVRRQSGRQVWAVLCVLVVALEVNQQFHARLLMR
jgi:hypothetical protein